VRSIGLHHMAAVLCNRSFTFPFFNQSYDWKWPKALVPPDLTQLPLKSVAPASLQRRPTMSASDFRLLGDFEGIINLDAQVSHRRLKLGVTEQQLHGTQILGAPIDQRRLGPSH
jgi:hypothetical protein